MRVRRPLNGFALDGTAVRLAIAAVLLLTACSAKDPLDWIDHAEPARMAKQDIAGGHFRFLSICGYACELPGLGEMTYFRCYSASASIETVDGTSDVIRSDRHLHLQNKARILASEYNQLIARRLDELGRRTCPVGEQWDALLLALSDHVKRVTAERSRAWVSAFDDPKLRGYDFRIHSRDGSGVGEATRASICAIVSQHGIQRLVRFAETLGDVETPEKTDLFSCKAGKLAT
jgi:hypothetical protein